MIFDFIRRVDLLISDFLYLEGWNLFIFNVAFSFFFFLFLFFLIASAIRITPAFFVFLSSFFFGKVLLGFKMSFLVIKENQLGLLYRKSGRTPKFCVSFKGESGYQTKLLKNGRYWGYWSWLYKVKLISPIVVPINEIAIVVAKCGKALKPGLGIADFVESNNFQDAEAFLKNGGQQGVQPNFLPTGQYNINTELFDVIMSNNAEKHGFLIENFKKIIIKENYIGVVTVLDAPLHINKENEPSLYKHDYFQSPHKFMRLGGWKGMQESILPEGGYFINPVFAKVKQIPLFDIPAGNVGVVVSHTGDVSLEEKELVESKQRGVWKQPLYARKHAINTYTKSVHLVPTHDITLNWSSNMRKPADNYDAELDQIKLQSKDGFDFSIDFTQVIRIPPQQAPLLISRIGHGVIEKNSEEYRKDNKSPAIRGLVHRVLAPLINSHFVMSSEEFDALAFHELKTKRQEEAEIYINEKLLDYGVEGAGTFIKNVTLPKELVNILNERTRLREKINQIKEKLPVLALEEEEKEKEALINARIEQIEAESKKAIAVLQSEGEIEGIIGLIGKDNYHDLERTKLLSSMTLPDQVIPGLENPLATMVISNLIQRNNINQDVSRDAGSKEDFLESILSILKSNKMTLSLEESSSHKNEISRF